MSGTKAPDTKVREVQERRRSNAARPHRNKRRYHRPTAKKEAQ